MQLDASELNLGTTATGPAGHGVFMEKPKGQVDVGPNGATVEVSLNTASLARAVAKSDVKDILQPGSKLSDITAKHDAKYAASVEKRSGSALEKSAMPKLRASRTNYRPLAQQVTQQAPTAKPAIGPIARHNNRQLLQLRATFNQIANRPKQQVHVSVESMSADVKQKMTENDIQNGRPPRIATKRDQEIAASVKPKKSFKASPSLQAAHARWSQVDSYISGPTLKGNG